MGARFADRIERAQKAMAVAGLDILVVTNRENLIYFTGVTQIECLALLIPREGEACAVALWLDADYVREHSGLKTQAYLFPRRTLGAVICENIRSFGWKEPRIGFERYFVDFAVYDALRSEFNERNFIGAGELFYRLRSVKDPEELELIKCASQAVCKGMEAAMKAVRPGAAELDVLAGIEKQHWPLIRQLTIEVEIACKPHMPALLNRLSGLGFDQTAIENIFGARLQFLPVGE